MRKKKMDRHSVKRISCRHLQPDLLGPHGNDSLDAYNSLGNITRALTSACLGRSPTSVIYSGV